MKSKKYYDIVERNSNLRISRIEEGSLSRWIAHFGGDDSQLERFLIEKEVAIAGIKYELEPHAPTTTPKVKK